MDIIVKEPCLDPRPVCPRCEKADRVVLLGEPGMKEMDPATEKWWRKLEKTGEARAWELHRGAFCDGCMMFVGVPV
jgi:hypothetical protein